MEILTLYLPHLTKSMKIQIIKQLLRSKSRRRRKRTEGGGGGRVGVGVEGGGEGGCKEKVIFTH